MPRLLFASGQEDELTIVLAAGTSMCTDHMPPEQTASREHHKLASMKKLMDERIIKDLKTFEATLLNPISSISRRFRTQRGLSAHKY